MDQEILERINTMMAEEATKLGLELIKVRFNPNGEMGATLEVLIDHDYSITMEEIQKFTDVVSPKLDSIEGLTDAYMLDISSGGSEREIPATDLPKLVGHYLEFVLLKSGETILAKLLSADSEKIEVLYFIKGRKKQVVYPLSELKSIHMGYKA